MALPVIAAKIGAGLLLPYLMKLIGAKALPALAKGAMTKTVTPAVAALTRVPTGMVVAKLTAKAAPQLINKAGLPASAIITHKAGQMLPAALRIAAIPESTKLNPTLASNALNLLGQGVSTAGTAGQFILPFAMGTLGRGVQGASTAAGAGLAALGNVPGALRSAPRVREQYGATPLDVVADMSSGLGQAAGIGVSALGNAAGSSINDFSNALRLMNLRNVMHDRTLRELQEIQTIGADPSTKRLYEQMIRTQGRTR